MDSSENTSMENSGNGVLPTQANDTDTIEAVDHDPKQNLIQVINSIQRTLAFLHHLYLTVSTFNAASQLPLLRRLNVLVMELDNLIKLSDKLNIQVPTEVLSYIDDGKNPDDFTRDVINNCISTNQATKGQADAFKSLRSHLLEELEQAFPEEVEHYREIRAISAAESKQLAEAQSSLPNGDVKVNSEL
ncbi:hypothetical protein JCGZ_20360 [Jatropha curcas]|uniref:Mediator of RNA polymerase II transcription subunit 10 n=2 Tax=Jatropha curcas TaxID=180498 RepID=A0A067K0B9_JATCU|nr:hypothetical protein JCGZ_20360 [Jatropha curcas]